MSLASCREIRQALGVYVLGAIDPAERAQVDEHLATCLDCREELASLAGLPAMLRKVPVMEAERLAAAEGEPDAIEIPSERLLTSLVARTSNVRRMHRWRSLAAAAAVVLVALGGGAAIANAFESGPPAAAMHWRLAANSTTDPVHLTVMYRQVAWGTEIKTNVTGNLPPGTVCQLQAVDAQGKVMVLGGWQDWSGSAWYPASTSISPAGIRTFELTIGGKVVASVPT
jgi:predicted anti-sigma-YlaC factor YlaD